MSDNITFRATPMFNRNLLVEHKEVSFAILNRMVNVPISLLTEEQVSTIKQLHDEKPDDERAPQWPSMLLDLPPDYVVGAALPLSAE